MSLESAKKFIKKIQEDENFSNSFFACKDPQDKKEFMKEHGFDFTKEEIDEAKENIDVSGGNCCGVTCETDSSNYDNSYVTNTTWGPGA